MCRGQISAVEYMANSMTDSEIIALNQQVKETKLEDESRGNSTPIAIKEKKRKRMKINRMRILNSLSCQKNKRHSEECLNIK